MQTKTTGAADQRSTDHWIDSGNRGWYGVMCNVFWKWVRVQKETVLQMLEEEARVGGAQRLLTSLVSQLDNIGRLRLRLEVDDVSAPLLPVAAPHTVGGCVLSEERWHALHCFFLHCERCIDCVSRSAFGPKFWQETMWDCPCLALPGNVISLHIDSEFEAWFWFLTPGWSGSYTDSCLPSTFLWFLVLHWFVYFTWTVQWNLVVDGTTLLWTRRLASWSQFDAAWRLWPSCEELITVFLLHCESAPLEQIAVRSPQAQCRHLHLPRT